MKNYLHYVLGLVIGTVMTGCIFSYFKADNSNELIKLRKERDMYNRLYREANTAISHFQDSVNLHCVCR